MKPEKSRRAQHSERQGKFVEQRENEQDLVAAQVLQLSKELHDARGKQSEAENFAHNLRHNFDIVLKENSQQKEYISKVTAELARLESMVSAGKAPEHFNHKQHENMTAELERLKSMVSAAEAHRIKLGSNMSALFTQEEAAQASRAINLSISAR